MRTDIQAMSDAQLVDAFWDCDEPLDAMVYARSIENAELRERMVWEAKVWRQHDEEGYYG